MRPTMVVPVFLEIGSFSPCFLRKSFLFWSHYGGKNTLCLTSCTSQRRIHRSEWLEILAAFLLANLFKKQKKANRMTQVLVTSPKIPKIKLKVEREPTWS